jgi:hypothetical protein
MPREAAGKVDTNMRKVSLMQLSIREICCSSHDFIFGKMNLLEIGM